METLMVTGGAGFLGFHICKKLSEKFEKIIVVDIDTINKKDYDNNVKYFKLDISNKKDLDNLIKNEKPSFIIHGAAALPLHKKEIIKKVNIGGTRNVLNSAIKHGIKRVTFISSTAVYGIPKRHPIYENDSFEGVGTYGETKIVAEKICKEYRKKGLCVPIIRPKTFIGIFRLGVFQILYDWVENGKRIPIIGNGKNRYQLLEVEDLVDAIYLTLIKPKEKVNSAFNVGAKKFETVYEDVSTMCKYANSGARVMKTPTFIVNPFLRLFEILGISPLYKWVYGTADKDSFVSIEKIEKTLGWKPKCSNAKALIKSYQWYIDNKQNLQGTGLTHRVAWNQGILEFIKKFL